MAQRVQAVPNPRYQTAPLETTGATIVSTRRVLVPPIVQGIFKGQRDYSGSNLNYIQFQIADNESFLDTKCLILVVDFTLFGPNARDNSSAFPTPTSARTYGRDLDVVFDQSTSAIITQLTIGSPQGLKFEEIMNYNLWGNIVAVQTETQLHKQADFLKMTQQSKHTGQDYGLSHFTDQQWRKPCRVKVGERLRLFIRFDFSDFLQNIDLFPLFLLRNGLQFTIYLESAFKVFYAPHGYHPATDWTLLSSSLIASGGILNTPSYIIGPGAYYLDQSANPILRQVPATGNAGVGIDSAVYYPPNFALGSMYTGTAALVPTFNTLWLPLQVADRFLSTFPTGWSSANAYLIPITMIELNQIVWSGFIRVDRIHVARQGDAAHIDVSAETGSRWMDDWAGASRDQWLGNTGIKDGKYTTIATVLSGTAVASEAALETAEANARTSVPQLDVDQIDHARWSNVAGGPVPIGSIIFRRYPFNASEDLSAGQSLDVRLVGFPMFSFHDQQWIPYVNFPVAPDALAIAAAHNAIANRGGRCIVHFNDAVEVTFATGVAAGSNGPFTADPGDELAFTPAVTAANTIFSVADCAKNGAASMLSLWNLPSAARAIHYQIENPQLLLDLVKPGAQEFMQWQQAFSSPSGIPIKFKKPIYRKLSFQSQSSGLLQVQLPINVRSLTGVVFVIMDPALNTEPNDLLNCLALPNLSTFQNRRLTEFNIQVGGQQYPAYPPQIRPDGTNIPYCDIHLLENEKFFGVAGSASFNCSLTRPMLRKTRNMLAGGWLGSSNPINVANLSSVQRCTYTDTSGFVVCMNLAKDWVRPFTTGIDSSQAGSIALNLYFKDPSGVSNVSSAFGGNTGSTNNATGARSFDIHMFAMCDAVATLQETANLVRY